MNPFEIDLTKTPSQIFSKRLARIRFSQLIIKDLENIDSIQNMELKKIYLLQNYIVSLVAAWQIFIEELLRYGVKEMLRSNSNNPLKEILENNLHDRLNRFNTPNSQNIDEIFKRVLGIDKITSLLDRPSETRQKIDAILKIRHQVAHKGYSDQQLELGQNFLYLEFLFKVAQDLETIVKAQVKK